jgi:hypothetical protein
LRICLRWKLTPLTETINTSAISALDLPSRTMTATLSSCGVRHGGQRGKPIEKRSGDITEPLFDYLDDCPLALSQPGIHKLLHVRQNQSTDVGEHIFFELLPVFLPVVQQDLEGDVRFLAVFPPGRAGCRSWAASSWCAFMSGVMFSCDKITLFAPGSRNRTTRRANQHCSVGE